ncbi:hypothetical protein DPMN_095487 [Dreissena polymorpha]|uniref:Uncharacterized protein n=1 Tax=Dreissena polymorpha TaxID=45954 RepID=A0A9D4L7H1_DREPO|nr:hypothetical protein DPMN_095487 [Dreissena polymorpha]
MYIIGTNLLTKFYFHRIINVASRVFTRKNAPPPGGHVFQPTRTIFELVQDIIRINLLTKKNDPPPCGHVFQAIGTIYELVQDIIGTNLLTMFHDDRTINVASRVLSRKNATPPWRPCFSTSRNHFQTQPTYHWDIYRTIHVASIVLTRKNAPPAGGHIFKATSIIFELVQDIIGMNLRTMFHEDCIINEATRVLKRKNAPPLGSHVFQANKTIFELIQDTIKTNLLTKFHEDWTTNVASNVLTRQMRSQKLTISTSATGTIFEHVQDIIETNLQTKFHDDWKINVASRVLTRKNAPHPGGHFFQPTGIIFKLVQDIIGINLLTKVLTRFYNSHIYSHIKKNALPLVSHVFQANVTIFELIHNIIEINFQTKFHEDWTINVASRVKNSPPPDGHRTINVASRVLTRKNAPPLGSQVFQANTNLLTNFHEDLTINVASRLLSRQILTPHNRRRTTDKRGPQNLTMSPFCSVSARKNAPRPRGHVFQQPITTNVLTEFHEDWTINKTSRVLTRFQYCFCNEKNFPAPWRRPYIIGTHVLTNFHEDWAEYMTSKVKNATNRGGNIFQQTRTIFQLIQDIIIQL